MRLQKEPEPVDRLDVPYGLLNERVGTGGNEDGRVGFVVYLLRNDRLVAVPRLASTAATPRGVIEALLRGPTLDEIEAGLSSAIPPETSVQSVDRDGGRVTLDFNAALGTADDLAAAIRQLQTTLRELPGVDAVRTLIEGSDVAPLVTSGSSPVGPP